MPDVTDGLEGAVDGVLFLPDWDDRAVGQVEAEVAALLDKLRTGWDGLQRARLTVEPHFAGGVRQMWDEDWRRLEGLRGQLEEQLRSVPGRLAAGNEAREAMKRQRLQAVNPPLNAANDLYNWLVD